MAKAPPRLGKLQHQMMQILWARGRATAREITAELSRSAPVAHSTVQTLLRKLEAKGAVTHDVEDRTFIFRPLFQPSDLKASATRDLLSRLFDGSVSALLTHLLKHEEITPEELEELRRLINDETLP
jgi:BlaI family transcriptional regulator, penicillinase repressor